MRETDQSERQESRSHYYGERLTELAMGGSLGLLLLSLFAAGMGLQQRARERDQKFVLHFSLGL